MNAVKNQNVTYFERKTYKMKKIVSLALVALLAVAMVGMSSFANNSFTASSGTCVVDGVKDDAYVSAAIPVNHEADPAAATGVAYAAWDSDYLYIFMQVTDSTVTPAADVTGAWSNDCGEFYVNLSGTEGATTEINAGQWTYGPSFPAFAGMGIQRDTNVDNGKFAYTYTDTGYTVEIAIPWGADYKPAEGASFPFCIAVNDDADGDASSREYQTFTGADQGSAWSTADSTWDAITLSAEKYEVPVEIIEEEAPAATDAAADTTVATTTPAAAQTSDALVAMAAVAAFALAGVVVVKKVRG